MQMKPGHFNTKTVPAATILLVCVSISGCGEDTKLPDAVTAPVQQMQQQVQKKVDQGVETVKQQVNLAGSIELSLKEPLSINACYAALAVLPEPRQSVLQLTSYKTVDQEAFPSVFVRAPVQAEAPAELAGKTLSAQLFVQPASDGPVWHSKASEPVELTVSKVEQQVLTVELSRGTLVNTETDETIEVTGTFTANF
jgi:hypothetical protein